MHRVVGLLIAAIPLSGAVEAQRGPAIESPLIATLERDLTARPSQAAAAFWRTVASRTTPIVEPLPGDAAHVLATFLWRDPDGTTHDVVLQARPNGTEPYHDPANHLRHVPGTDVWFASFQLPIDAEFIYQFAVNPPPEAMVTPTTAVLRASLRTDPLNPHRYPEPDGGGPPLPLSQSVSVARMPGTPSNPWMTRSPGVPAGMVQERTVASAALNGNRTVWVYRSAGEERRDERLLILFDGQVYLNRIPTATMLDNLLAARKIAPTLALLVDNGGAARASDLTFSDRYLTFLTDELLPWAEREYHFAATPSRTVVGGSSLGGLTAVYAAYRRPDVFGVALSQSGSFDEPKGGEDGGQPEWMARRLESAPKSSARFCLEVGQMEAATGLLAANRHLRDVLTARSYRVQYFEVFGAHDPVHWRRTLPELLMSALS